jgi:hypothetical protein
MNNGYYMMCMEAVVAYVEAFKQHLPAGTVGGRAEARIGNLQLQPNLLGTLT